MAESELSALLQRLEPMRLSEIFGGAEVREGRVHVYVAGGEAALRASSYAPDELSASTGLIVHDCPYTEAELLSEARRLGTALSDGLGGGDVVAIAPRPDGSGLTVTCRLGTSVEEVRAASRSPMLFEWGEPPTAAGV